MGKVYIIGIGPGTEDFLLPLAKKKIEESDCLVGAKRHLWLFRALNKEEVPIEGHFDKVIAYIKTHKKKKQIAILVSGDPGLYSLLEKVSGSLKKEEYEVIPGISALQLAFARIGQSWYDTRVISLHGRKIDNLTSKIKPHNKIFLFTDSKFPPHKIATHLLREGLDNRRAVVLEHLSYPSEKIVDTDLEGLSRMKGFGLCAMIIEANSKAQRANGSASKGKLYGIGIGPGDPKLVTLKAREILDRVDIVFVPKGNADGESFARSIVEAVVTTDKNFRELTFPMTTDKSILNKYWLAASCRIAKEVNRGKEVAFVTIGDPFIYSTYVYLLQTLQRNFPYIDVETVPGVSAFNAASSKANFALVQGAERLAVVPVTRDLKGLKEALVGFETVVLMKVGAKLDKVVSLLKELGLSQKAVLISRLGHEEEKIVYDLTSLKDKKIGYLSVILVKKDGNK